MKFDTNKYLYWHVEGSFLPGFPKFRVRILPEYYFLTFYFILFVGSESDSDHDYDVVDENGGKEKAESSKAKKGGDEEEEEEEQMEEQEEEEGDEERKSGDENAADEEEEIEEVRNKCLAFEKCLRSV